MKVIAAPLLLLTFILPLRAEASWFEFCRMEGRVESATSNVANSHRSFDLRVVVSKAQPDDSATLESYTDCSEYVGKSVELTLQLREQDGIPAQGDGIVFTRSVVDSFDDPIVGDAASSVQVKLLAYVPSARH